MSADLEEEARAFLAPKLYSRAEVLDSPCPVPAVAGIYGWWFSRLPADINVAGCQTCAGYTLLYTGISPRKPPNNGKPPSEQTLRDRVVTHYAGNAEGSTLRKTLGCLLADELGIEIRRVGSGKRMTFLHGEQTLSAWMDAHARVSWMRKHKPWELEDYLIEKLDLPVNLQDNSRNAFHPSLSQSRAAAVARAPYSPSNRTRVSAGGRAAPDTLT